MNTKQKRKVCVITGTRAEYGLLKSVMHAIQKSENLTLQLLVSGMHLSSDFGFTEKYISDDGFLINARVPMLADNDSLMSMADSIGKGICGMARAFKKLKPDIVLVLGDRVEALSGALAAAYSGIYVAHIHGGDSAEAGLDENARHAITKIAHIHFPATPKSAERIERMGEDALRIFMVGAPGLDEVVSKKFKNKEGIAELYHLDLSNPSMLVVQHPVSTESKHAARQMEETLKAIVQLRLQTIVVFPNADAGGRSMISLIKRYARSQSFIKIYPSVPRTDYLGLLNTVDVLVGNSSSGIIESAVFYLPVVDIGTRQRGREHSANVLHVGYRCDEITEAIQKALTDSIFLNRVKKSKNVYGSGGVGEKIAHVLSSITLDYTLLQKKITY